MFARPVSFTPQVSWPIIRHRMRILGFPLSELHRAPRDPRSDRPVPVLLLLAGVHSAARLRPLCTGLGSVGLIVFAIYMAMLVAIGFIAARFQKTSEDFWVAGRRFGIGLMVVAEMASVLHGGSVQGGVALAARFGGVAILPYISFAIASLIIVRFFAKKLRMMSGFTLPDYMGARFESTFLRGYSALIIFISSVLYMIAQIRVMGFLLERLLGIPFVAGMALGTGIFILFVTLGGLLAVVWTDILLFVLMWTGLIALMPAVTAAAGGLTHVLIAADRVAPGWTSVRGTTWSWTYLVSWWLVWVVGYATRVTMITKVFAAKDTRVARISLPITDALFMIFLLYGNLYLGAAARVLVLEPDRESARPGLSRARDLRLEPRRNAVARRVGDHRRRQRRNCDVRLAAPHERCGRGARLPA